MTLIFDTATVRFDTGWMLLLPAGAALVTLGIALRGGRPRSVLLGVVVTLFLVVLTVVLPLADYRHVHAALRNGSARTTEGVISAHKRETTKSWTGRSRGVGISSFDHYTTHTSEQFFVGRQWFWLRVGEFPSGASFTNAADPPVVLRDGMRARVTWFEDPWNGGETRILKLEIEDGPATATPGKTASKSAGRAAGKGDAAPGDFAAFWQRFSAAAARGDRDAVRDLTRFPFLFAGTPLDQARFGSIWMGIFPEPLRPCFATASPVRDGDGMSVSCGAYVYVFEKGATGWRFTDFTADPEGLD